MGGFGSTRASQLFRSSSGLWAVSPEGFLVSVVLRKFGRRVGGGWRGTEGGFLECGKKLTADGGGAWRWFRDGLVFWVICASV